MQSCDAKELEGPAERLICKASEGHLKRNTSCPPSLLQALTSQVLILGSLPLVGLLHAVFPVNSQLLCYFHQLVGYWHIGVVRSSNSTAKSPLPSCASLISYMTAPVWLRQPHMPGTPPSALTCPCRSSLGGTLSDSGQQYWWVRWFWTAQCYLSSPPSRQPQQLSTAGLSPTPPCITLRIFHICSKSFGHHLWHSTRFWSWACSWTSFRERSLIDLEGVCNEVCLLPGPLSGPPPVPFCSCNSMVYAYIFQIFFIPRYIAHT